MKPYFTLRRLRFVAITCLLALLGSCNDEAYLDSPKPKDLTASYIRSIEEAYQSAQEYMENDNHMSRSDRMLKDVCTVNVISESSRLGRAGSDTLLYAFDFENEEGFIIVAAPRNINAILAVTESGNFNSIETLTNPGFQYTLNATKNYVSNIWEIDTTKIRPQKYMYKDSIVKNIKQTPRLQVQWGQRYPENIFAENKVAGCVPVAIGQVLSFFEEPCNISYHFPLKDISNENLNWTDVKKHSVSNLDYEPDPNQLWLHNLNYNCTDSRHKTIGRIIREAGYLSSTNYMLPNGSGASYQGAVSALKKLFPNKDITCGSGVPFTSLENTSSVSVIIGFDGSSGHAWVADAISDYILWELVIDPKPMTLVGSEPTGEFCSEGKIISKNIVHTQKVHYNWGWGGNCNGWFDIKIFAPGASSASHDNPNANNSSNQDFKENISYIHIK